MCKNASKLFVTPETMDTSADFMLVSLQSEYDLDQNFVLLFIVIC